MKTLFACDSFKLKTEKEPTWIFHFYKVELLNNKVQPNELVIVSCKGRYFLCKFISQVMGDIAHALDKQEKIAGTFAEMILEDLEDMDNLPVVDFTCLDCKSDTDSDGLQEYYSVKDEIWFSVVPPSTKWSPHNNGMLCIGCLEKRLGRELTRSDFIDCPLNDLEFPWTRSERLISRLSKK